MWTEPRAQHLSEKTRELFKNMLMSGQSESVGVVEILDTTAQNGPDYATDEQIAGSAREIRRSARRVEHELTDGDRSAETRDAQQALDAVYEHTSYSSEPPDTLPTYVADLLGNLKQLCHERGIDFGEAIRRGHNHFESRNNDEVSQNS